MKKNRLSTQQDFCAHMVVSFQLQPEAMLALLSGTVSVALTHQAPKGLWERVTAYLSEEDPTDTVESTAVRTSLLAWLREERRIGLKRLGAEEKEGA